LRNPGWFGFGIDACLDIPADGATEKQAIPAKHDISLHRACQQRLPADKEERAIYLAARQHFDAGAASPHVIADARLWIEAYDRRSHEHIIGDCAVHDDPAAQREEIPFDNAVYFNGLRHGHNIADHTTIDRYSCSSDDQIVGDRFASIDHNLLTGAAIDRRNGQRRQNE